MKDDYAYILYPVKTDKLKEIGIPVFDNEKNNKPLEIIDEENFVPLWYGTAKFPEDDI